MYKVLIVDDEALVRIGLKTTIDWENLGFTIIGDAANGEQAFELYQKYNPEIIITDIRMPKKDGFYLIEKIREINQKSKILVLTVYDEFSYVRKALKLGADDYILKTEIEDEELEDLMLKLKEELKKDFSEEEIFNQKNKKMIQKSLFNRIIRNDFNLDQKITDDLFKVGFELKKNNFILVNILTTSTKKDLKDENLSKINNALINIVFEELEDKGVMYNKLCK